MPLTSAIPDLPDAASPGDILAALSDPALALDGLIGVLRDRLTNAETTKSGGRAWSTQARDARRDVARALMERHVPAARALVWATACETAIIRQLNEEGTRARG